MAAKRTPEELLVASRHVNYEVSMLKWTAGRLAQPGLSQPEVNALLESFTIHTRALQYFFYPPKNTRDDDVLAQDFMPASVSWERLAGTRPSALARVPERVGTEIAHISYGRLSVTPEAKQWNVSEITEALLRLIKTFVEHAATLDPVWAPQTFVPVLDLRGVSSTGTATNAPIVSVSSPSVQKIFGADD